MVSLLPLRDIEILNRLNAEAGESCSFAYCLYDGQVIDGYLLYDVQEKEAVLRFVNAADEPSFDGLVRAVFSSLYDIHINRALFGEKVDRSRLEALSFVAKGESVTPSIEDILYNCKHCRQC